MTDRRSRSEKLVHDIRVALERGVGPDRIQAELVRRNVPPFKAALLVSRIVATTSRPVPSTPAASPRHRTLRRGRWSFFALGLALLLAGVAGVFLTTRESAARPSDADVVARLDGEVSAARGQLAHLESRIETRRVDATQIEWLRARVARGPHSFDDPADYAAMVARYQRRRASWNRTLPDYQVVSQAFRTLAAIHNAKVDSLAELTRRDAALAGGAGGDPGRYVRVAVAVAPM